jgi:YbbR domain-containing protein
VRAFLRSMFVDNLLLKLISLGLAVVLFAVVRNEKDAVSGVYLKVDYLLPRDQVLVSDDPPPEVRVTVRGPTTRVNHLDEERLEHLRVDLLDARSGERRLDESMIKLPAGLRVVTISPSSIRASFEPRVERIVPVQPVIEGEPAAGYRVVKSQAQPRTVRVSGAKAVVDAISRAPTHPFQIADARETVHGPIDLSPAPRHAEWKGTTSVVVDVEVAPVLAERVLRGQSVRVTGTQRMEAQIEPSVADVVLRGPAEAFSQIEPGTPSLLVDAQAEDGRAAGTFRKRIAVVGLPSGIAAEVRPESLTLITRRRRE